MIVFVVFVLLSSSSISLHPGNFELDYTKTFNDSAGSMIILSDSDFEAYGWSGNGSAENPYILNQEEFEDENFIRIRNTRSHFRIVNCTFNVEYYAVEIYNVTNGEIINNTIIPQFAGIDLSSCDSILILENTIRGGYESLFITESNNTFVLNNTFACIQLAVWLYRSKNTTVVGNELATVEQGYTAVDEFGVNNHWDDGLSLGNAWYHYNGTGAYNIPGSTNSTDHFPTVYCPPFPIDFEGPVIRAPGGSLYVDYMYEFPSHWRFEARVSDPSGVEMVTITVNDAIYEMTHQPTSDDPDLYVYDYPNPRYMRYSFWAVDSLGYETEAPGGFISIGVFGGLSQLPTLTTILLQITAILAIISLVVWWKRDAIRHSRFISGATRNRYHLYYPTRVPLRSDGLH
ncbi:MAG: NosD domain-containing protein [Candidatus Thorarchaeota archaeon]